jgi:hypothetical protein
LSGVALFALTVLSALCVITALNADEVLLSSGGRIQGDVISQDERQVVLQTAYGRVTFQTADISKVLYSTPAEKELRLQLAGLKFSDVGGRLKLAEASSTAGLNELANSIYAQVIAINPEEKTARRALGYITYEGEWVTPRDKDMHPGLVPYKGKWVTVNERETLRQSDADRQYFNGFGLSSAAGDALLNSIADINLEIEPRGGYIVRRHVKTWPVKDKPYVYSTDILNWQRLGVFIGVSFLDGTRRRTNGIGTLSYTIYSVKSEAVGTNKVDKEIVSATVDITPEMWSRESDFKYWDTKINSTYDKIVADGARRAWDENYYMNSSGVLYVLANRDIESLVPPGVYYVEATFKLKDRVKKVGRYVQYAELR